MRKIASICLVLFLLVPAFISAEDKLTEEQAQVELLSLQQQIAEAEAKISELVSDVEALRAVVGDLEATRDGLAVKLDELKSKSLSSSI